MSGSIDSDPAVDQTAALIPLAAAAELLGCHLETLRKRVRRRSLSVQRGPHGRYYVEVDSLRYLDPIRRMKRRTFDTAALTAAWEPLGSTIHEPGASTTWQRRAIGMVREDPASDIHLFRMLSVRAYWRAGVNVEETAEHLGISTRQVRRLRRLKLTDGLAAAFKRRQASERGKVRAAARVVVRDLQRRLAAGGFRPARRNPRAANSGTREGMPARVALVHRIDTDQERHLLSQGVTEEEIAAIRLVGIGPDELNELILRGPGSPLIRINPFRTQPMTNWGTTDRF